MNRKIYNYNNDTPFIVYYYLNNSSKMITNISKLIGISRTSIYRIIRSCDHLDDKKLDPYFYIYLRKLGLTDFKFKNKKQHIKNDNENFLKWKEEFIKNNPKYQNDEWIKDKICIQDISINNEIKKQVNNNLEDRISVLEIQVKLLMELNK